MSIAPSPSRRRVYICVVVIFAIGVGCWLSIVKRVSSVMPTPMIGKTSEMAAGMKVIASLEPIKMTRPMSPERDQVSRLVVDALNAMRRGDTAEVDVILVQLAEMFSNKRGNPEASIEAILEFLKTGQDAATGMGFAIGEGGILTEATSLRVYLMDKLGQLSREAGGDAALGVAREVLKTFGSADEWAVSMRNVAWLDPTSRSFLQDRVFAMLNHREWQDAPSVGMLESFDVIVHAGAMATVPELSRLVSLKNSSLARASSVALDRLAGMNGLELTSLLNRQPELFSAVPLVRADLFAHSDLGVSEQRIQLESYLLRPDVNAGERKKFFSSLIQTGQFLSHNLITPAVSPETPDQAAARMDILTRTVNGWLRDPRFSDLTGELTALGGRVNRIHDEITGDQMSK